MTIKGVPVVVVESGGVPVTPVVSGAPLLTISQNGLGTPITITENASPFILDGMVPPAPPGPLDVVVRDNNGFTNFEHEFDLASDSVIFGLACAFTGDPVISIAHGGEPLTIINRAESEAAYGKKWLSLLAVGRGLTVGPGLLTINATGGELHGGACRINEMAFIDTPETGWDGSASGSMNPITPVSVTSSSGGVIKGVLASSAADRQHVDQVIGATDVFNGHTTTGDPVPVDMSTSGPWILGAGWSIDGDDFVHTGPSSLLSMTFPETGPVASFRCEADLTDGASVRINGYASETYMGPGIWPIATYQDPAIRRVDVRGIGDLRVSRCSLVDNAVAVDWLFFTAPAETGARITFQMRYSSTRWTWTATEVMGEDY